MNNRIGLPHWGLIVSMVFMTFSLLHGYFTITARGWIWIPFACLMCFMLSTAVFRSKQFLWMMVYFIVLVLNLLIGKASNSNNYLILNFATLLWAISFPFIIRRDVNRQFVKTFVIVELFVVLLTAVLTIIVDFAIPGVVRQSVAYINSGQSEMAVSLYRLGVCEYGLPHAIPIIMPAIVMYARHRSKSVLSKMLTIIVVFVLSYFVFISGITTAILLLAFSIIGSLIISTVSSKKTYTRLIILGLFALPFANENVVVSVISGIADVVPEGNSFHGKLISIENTIKYDEAEGSVEAREDKYSMSWKSFRENPLTGGSGEVISGGHSAILDNFGAYGLLGGIPFLLLIFSHIKFVYKQIPEDSKSFYLVGAISFVAMLASKNMSNIYTWMFVSAFLPLLLMYGHDKAPAK